MMLALEAASPVTRMWFLESNVVPASADVEWDSGRDLADQLLGRIAAELKSRSSEVSELTGLIIFSGPGSFTSLRIGHTTLNALADSLNIPIVGAQGDDWINRGLARLQAGDNDKIALPFYGAEANITKSRSQLLDYK